MAIRELITTNFVSICAYLIFLLIVFLIVARKFNNLIEESNPSSITKIGNIIGDEQVKIIGTPQSIKPLQAPYSNEDCVFYSYTIEQKERSYDVNRGFTKPEWQVIGSAQRGVPFILADDTGHVLVDPKNSQISLAITSQGPLDGAHHFHAKHPLVRWIHRTFAPVNELWVTEHAITPKHSVLINGYAPKELVKSPIEAGKHILSLKSVNPLAKKRDNQIPLIISVTQPAAKLQVWEHWYKTTMMCASIVGALLIIVIIISFL
ncbi:MAG TPA: GIDE domain-containing protein [Acidobacteriota bacterium]|nr:GIDE domain-containing protein [Acidobacteriota bacterium]